MISDQCRLLLPVISMIQKEYVRPGRLITSVAILLGLLIFLSPSAGAAAFTEEKLADGTVSLHELLEETLNYNKELAAAVAQSERYNVRIPLVENLDEQLLAFYYLDFPVGNMSGGWTKRINQAQAEGMKKVNIKGKRGKVLTGRDMVENQALWYQYVSEDLHLQVKRRVIEKFYQLYYLDQIIEAIEQNLDTLGRLIRVSESQYSVGKIKQKDVVQVQIKRSQLVADLLELRQQRLVLVTELNYLSSRAADSPLVPVVESPLTHETIPDLKFAARDLVSGLYQNRPLFKGYQALGARFRAMKMMIQMYFNREVRTEAAYEAESGMRWIQAKGADFYNKVTADLMINLGELEKNRDLANLYGSVMIPQTRQTFQARLADFQVGRDDYLNVLQLLLDLNSYQVKYFRALSDYLGNLANLEGLSGLKLF